MKLAPVPALTLALALCTLLLTGCWSEPEPDPLIASPGPGCWMLQAGGPEQTGTYALEVGVDGGTSLSSRGGPAVDGPAWNDTELQMIAAIGSRHGEAQVLAVSNALERDEVSRQEATFHLQQLRAKLLAAPPC